MSDKYKNIRSYKWRKRILPLLFTYHFIGAKRQAACQERRLSFFAHQKTEASSASVF